MAIEIITRCDACHSTIEPDQYMVQIGANNGFANFFSVTQALVLHGACFNTMSAPTLLQHLVERTLIAPSVSRPGIK